MSWVLILIVFGRGYANTPTVTIIDFLDRKSCEATVKEFADLAKQIEQYGAIVGTCNYRGEL